MTVASVAAVVLQALAAVAVFGLVVFVHEWGHFAAARAFGIGVREFSIGMGPALRSWMAAGTRWSLRGIPLGGFVLIEGMEEEDAGEESAPEGARFDEKPVWQRMTVLAAGSLANLALAYAVWSASFMAWGVVDSAIVVEAAGAPEMVSGDVPAGSVVAAVAVADRRADAVAWPDRHEFLATVDDARARGRHVVMDLVWQGRRLAGVEYRPEPGRTALELWTPAVFSGEVGNFLGEGPGRLVEVGAWTGVDGEPLTQWHIALAAADEAPVLLSGAEGMRAENFSRADLARWAEEGVAPESVAADEEVVWAGGRAGEAGLAAAGAAEVAVLFEPAGGGEQRRISIPREDLVKASGWQPVRAPLAPLGALAAGARETLYGMTLVRNFLTEIVRGERGATEDLQGPIGIFRLSMEVASQGFDRLLALVAVLSINLGLFNLLPIPALDGGRLFVLVVSTTAERLGSPFPKRLEGMIHTVGFIFLLLLILVVSLRDLAII